MKRRRGHFLREMFRSLAVGFPPPEILPQDNLHPSSSSLSFSLFLYFLYPSPSHGSILLSSQNSLVFPDSPRFLRHPSRTLGRVQPPHYPTLPSHDVNAGKMGWRGCKDVAWAVTRVHAGKLFLFICSMLPRNRYRA